MPISRNKIVGNLWRFLSHCLQRKFLFLMFRISFCKQLSKYGNVVLNSYYLNDEKQKRFKEIN